MEKSDGFAWCDSKACCLHIGGCKFESRKQPIHCHEQKLYEIFV